MHPNLSSKISLCRDQSSFISKSLQLFKEQNFGRKSFFFKKNQCELIFCPTLEIFFLFPSFLLKNPHPRQMFFFMGAAESLSSLFFSPLSCLRQSSNFGKSLVILRIRERKNRSCTIGTFAFKNAKIF